MKNAYDRPDTLFLTLEHKTYNFVDDTWSYADPDTGFPQITIIDPKGVTKIPVDPETPEEMNRDATGKWQFLYEILATAEPGWWKGHIDVENGGYPDREWFSFLVKG